MRILRASEPRAGHACRHVHFTQGMCDVDTQVGCGAKQVGDTKNWVTATRVLALQGRGTFIPPLLKVSCQQQGSHVPRVLPCCPASGHDSDCAMSFAPLRL